MSKRSVPASAPLVIVGAGPHALTIACRLLTNGTIGRDELVVLDPSGCWLDTWRRQFVAYDIPALRSPGVHHPAPDPGALAHWAEARDRQSKAAYGQPDADVFEDFCDELIRGCGLDGHVHPHRVELLCACADGAMLLVDDGSLLEARRVVLATNSARRRIPHWVEDFAHLDADRIAHAGDVNLTGVDVDGEEVAIVGGGLTAAHLAIGAIERGARTVHLLVRRDLRRSTFDTHPGWLGPKELLGFERLPPAERARAVLAARDGGSVPDRIAAQLRALQDLGRLHLRERTRVVAGQTVDGRMEVVLGDETRVRSDRLWLATGTEAAVDACPLLDDLRRSKPCDIHHGFPDLDHDLTWPGTTIHLCGRLASLQLGPAAGNLWGARKAAERIESAITTSECRAARRRSGGPVMPDRTTETPWSTNACRTDASRSWLAQAEPLEPR